MHGDVERLIRRTRDARGRAVFEQGESFPACAPGMSSPSLTFGRQKLAYLGAGYPLTR